MIQELSSSMNDVVLAVDLVIPEPFRSISIIAKNYAVVVSDTYPITIDAAEISAHRVIAF